MLIFGTSKHKIEANEGSFQSQSQTVQALTTTKGSNEVPTAPQQDTKFNFLDLPGEIRNLIYACMGDGLDVHTVKLVHSSSRRRITTTPSWILTQVNRLIRSEYTPSYARAVKVQIYVDNLHRYLAQVRERPEDSNLVSWMQYCPHLIVDMASPMAYNEVDLLPLFRFAIETPTLNIDFVFKRELWKCYVRELQRELNAVLSATRSNPDGMRILSCTSKIQLRPAGNPYVRHGTRLIIETTFEPPEEDAISYIDFLDAHFKYRLHQWCLGFSVETVK
ncbi:hypothetical protein K491DRAFT_717732 [Lophiostoma macrostomum CBS 122681]|uniref:F-box domain-containing protein n=1 Tax=Lophiostoma macrostomum CBS 122681 TaxID=1314788 RepID=A0A6A6T196_9PLEO|nr:hypothetical protein K491DRAFT_717732 [Lophiostoma macrostomum CBS 122681]